MKFDDKCSTLSVETVGFDHFPERKKRVETCSAHDLGDIEHIPECGSRRQRHAPEVEGKIELAIFNELWPASSPGADDCMRSQSRDDLGEGRYTSLHGRPVGRLVQHHHSDHCWTEDWVPADCPQQSVGTTHRVR